MLCTIDILEDQIEYHQMYTKVDVSDKTFESFKKGNEKAFALIFKIFYPLIGAYIFKLCQSREETEDLVHEAFITLYLQRNRIGDKSGLYPYLFTVAKRLTISNFRKKVTSNRYQEHLKQNWREETSSIEESIDLKDLDHLLKRVINELPPKQKQVYMLKKEGDLSYLEISNLLDISINTVKNHLVSASRHVKLRLSNYI
jgi:RNA polymerase sigma factor (sigma-70 family)